MENQKQETISPNKINSVQKGLRRFLVYSYDGFGRISKNPKRYKKSDKISEEHKVQEYKRRKK